MCCHKCVVEISERYVKSSEKCPLLYNEVFRCHGNICYVTFIDACFCNVHNIGPINVCTNIEINQSVQH